MNIIHITCLLSVQKKRKINKLLKIKRNRYWCTLSDSNTQAAGIQNLYKNFNDLGKTEIQAKEILSLPISEFLKKRSYIYMSRNTKIF